MREENVLSDLGAGESGDGYKYLVQRKSGENVTLKQDKFKSTTMKIIINIKNDGEGYSVTVKKNTVELYRYLFNRL